MKKVTSDTMFRRYELRDQRNEKAAAEAPGLNGLAQAQIGRRLGTSLWSAEEQMPQAFEEALQKIRKVLS